MILIPSLGISQKYDAASTDKGFKYNLMHFAVQKIDDVVNGSFVHNYSSKDAYLNKEFLLTKITNKSTSNNVLNTKANYNILKDRFEIIAGNELYLVDKNTVNQIEIGTHLFKISPLMNKNYYESLLTHGSYELIQYHESKIIEARTQTLGLLETKIENITRAAIIIDNKHHYIPKSRGELFDLLQLDEAKRKEFKKLKTKNIDQLKALIQSL